MGLHDLYPTAPSPHAKTYPIQRLASMAAVPYPPVTREGGLWELQQAVADCRFSALKHAVGEGMVPVAGRDPRITIRVYAEYDAIDAACDGIAVPDNAWEVRTYSYDRQVW